jgi:hypothetical protein
VRFMFPYSVRWPCRAVRCGRHPDDPAAAFVTVLPRGPPMPAASLVEAASWFGTRGGTGTRPCGFPPAPAATTAVSPVVSGRAPVRTGHAPPLLHGRCSATRASRRTAWPVCPAFAAPAALLGFSPFAALLPPAGVAAFPPLGPTCRFPGHMSRRFLRCDGLVGPSGRLPPEGEGDRRPRVTGRGSWASSPQAVRSVAHAARAAAADAALDFASLGSSVVAVMSRVTSYETGFHR